jgi:hypothetical protein
MSKRSAKAEFTFIPKLLVKGIAPDGTEYQLGEFGQWVAEELDRTAMQTLFATGAMSESQVRSHWFWTGRKDAPPPSLVLFIKRNPKFQSALPPRLPADLALQFLAEALAVEQAAVVKSLLLAFRRGHIRTYRISGADLTVNLLEFELHTKDFIKWLKFEHDITITKERIWEMANVQWTRSLMTVDGT